jgi:hypothetical protein
MCNRLSHPWPRRKASNRLMEIRDQIVGDHDPAAADHRTDV